MSKNNPKAKMSKGVYWERQRAGGRRNQIPALCYDLRE
jgi:hypothetical protein